MSKPDKENSISDNEFDAMFAEGKPAADKNSAFSVKGPTDVIAEMDNEEEEEEEEDVIDGEAGKDVLDSLNNDDDDDTDDAPVTGSLIEGIQELVTKGTLHLFVNEDGTLEKELSEYTKEDIAELLEQNINRHVESVAEKAPLEVFKTLPQSVQDVVLFSMNGGAEPDLKNIFAQLAHVQQTLELNPADVNDARNIVRQYHQAEGILSVDQIEDEIRSLEDREKLTEYATKHKERLDAQQAKILQAKLADQEKKKQQKASIDKQHAAAIISVMKKETISDFTLDLAHRKELFIGLTEKRYQDERGEAVNELQHLLHEKQYGENKDLDSVVLAYSILKDPKALISAIETKLRKEITSGVVKDIKDGNKRTLGSGTPPNTSVPPAGKKPQIGVKRKQPTVFSVKQ